MLAVALAAALFGGHEAWLRYRADRPAWADDLVLTGVRSFDVTQHR